MDYRVLSMKGLLALAGVLTVTLFVAVPDGAAQRGGGGQQQSAREAAPINLEGYWVGLVNEDWRHRMFTAQRGDYDLVRLNAEGRRVADAWEYDEQPAGEDNCLMTYGAAGIMRLPTRLNVHWADDNTLQVDLDAGTQTREFYFGESEAPGGQPTRQGYSVAEWETFGGGGGGGASLSDIPLGGHLKVVTTNMMSGFYFKNGIPYSSEAVMTEFFVPIVEPDGTQYLLVQTFVQDPTYLTQAFVRTLTFKRESDPSKWNPTPCSEY
jgi:hypothetical protein